MQCYFTAKDDPVSSQTISKNFTHSTSLVSVVVVFNTFIYAFNLESEVSLHGVKRSYAFMLRSWDFIRFHFRVYLTRLDNHGRTGS